MGVNEVIVGAETVLNLQELTVTPEVLLKGYTAVNAAGDLIVGTLEMKKKYSVALRGAPAETISISNGQTVETNFNSCVAPAIELEEGEYTVTGSASNFSRTINVTKNGLYNAYPDGAVMWYGNGRGDSANSLHSVSGGFQTLLCRPDSVFSYLSGYVVDNSGSGWIGLQCTHPWSGQSEEGGSILSNRAVPAIGAGYSRINFKINASLAGNSDVYLVASGNRDKFYPTAALIRVTKSGIQTLSAPINGAQPIYPGAFVWAKGGRYGLPWVKIHAIWLS